MNLIFLTNKNPFFENSASANRSRTLLEGLAQKGMQVKVFITDPFASQREKSTMGNEGQINGCEYTYVSKFVLKNFIISRLYFYIYKPFFPYLKAAKIKAIINRYADAVIWPSGEIEHSVAMKCKMPGHIYFSEKSEFPDFQNYSNSKLLQRWMANKKHAAFKRHVLPQLNGFALMTKTLVEYYKKNQGPLPQLLHLPMTVDLERFAGTHQPLKELESPYIAFIGIMSDVKEGVDVLLKAFAHISNNFPSHKLYLVGRWNYDTPNHQKLIKDLGLTGKAHWIGEYHRDKIPNILTNADLLVLPRPDSYQAKGGFPTKLGEYLAAGKPVCATTVGEIPDYLKDGESVYFSEPGSVSSLVHAIRKALSNPLLAQKVGIKGRLVAEKHFNKDIQAKSLYDFLLSFKPIHLSKT